MKRLLLLLFFVYPVLHSLQAQDNHYESDLLGSQNAILTGASISRWVDQTAVINNAATMIFAKEAGFTFNTATARFDNVKYGNGLGESFDLEASNTQIYAGLVAWEIPSLQRVGERTVGFSIYGRMHDRLNLANRVMLNANIIDDPEFPGKETFIGIYSHNSDIDETVGSLGWGERISDEWAIGLTTQVFFRGQKYQENFSATAIPNPDSSFQTDAVRSESNINLHYNTTMLQLKGSIAWQKADWSAGLVVSTPSVQVYGSGGMLAEVNLMNIQVHPGEPRNSYFANAYLESAKPRYKYPLSIDCGISRKLKNVHLSVAASWYAPIDRYTVINAGDATVILPSGDQNVVYEPGMFNAWSVNRSIVNFSTSASWRVSGVYRLMLGFRTDKHFVEFPDPEEEVPGFLMSKKVWNRYHFNTGAEIRWRRSFWIVGVQYSRGRAEDYPSPYSFSGVTEGNFLEGVPGVGMVRQDGLSFLVSFFFQFQSKDK